jgi:bacillithiol biosynthesis deacetylase BshB1
MKLDILAIGVHPDDIELGCAGTILKNVAHGKKVGILDLTKGELGTRGSGDLRIEEAKKSATILGVEIRENLGFSDGFFKNDKDHQVEIIKILRKYQPEIVLCNAPRDRHPDHGRASELVYESCFYSGLVKIETEFNGENQGLWRPKAVYHYIQDRFLKPDFVVDVSDYVDKKMEAIMAFSSQFYNPDSSAPETPISSKKFLDFVKSRMANFGRDINADYAEGYTVDRVVGVDDITELK